MNPAAVPTQPSSSQQTTRRFETDPDKLRQARIRAPKNSTEALIKKVSAGLAARKERGFSMTS
jgi:uncharacterized protein with NAD-binding domain and iron-sulfur cluster